jgi:hypothetical protein
VINLDETGNCDRATGCVVCAATADLDVQTAETPLGVICLTLCPPCTDAGKLPRFGMAEAVRMALDHCRHLGITADQMEAAMNPTDHTVRHYGTENDEESNGG